MFLEIPSDVQRCCTRCYEKLIIQVQERHVNQPVEDDDESTIAGNQNSKHDHGKITVREKESFSYEISFLSPLCNETLCELNILFIRNSNV